MSNLVKRQGQIQKLKGEISLDADMGLEVLGVCIDTSGSMGAAYNTNLPDIPEDPFEDPAAKRARHSGTGTRMNAARMAMDALYDKTDFTLCELKVWSFSDSPMAVPCDWEKRPDVPYIGNGTNFSYALREPIKENCSRIIFTSDGESSYPDGEIKECIRRGIVVDCIFIGDPGGEGESMLIRIARETGGKFTTASDAESLIESFKELETSERLGIEYKPDSGDDVIKL